MFKFIAGIKLTKMEKSQGWHQSKKTNQSEVSLLGAGKDPEGRQSIQNSNHGTLMWKTVAY